jgi:hypothetical protein
MDQDHINAFREIERLYRLADDALAAIQIDRTDIARKRLSRLLREIETKRPALALPPQQRNAAPE